MNNSIDSFHPAAQSAQQPTPRQNVRTPWNAGSLKKADPRMLVLVFAAIMISGVWLLTLFELHEAREAELQHATREVRSLARLFDEHASRTIDAADQAVTYLRYRFNEVGPALDINRDLKNILHPDDLYNLFTIADANGDMVLSSKAFKPTNLADREHVKVHMTTDSGELFISKPVLGRVSGKWSIQMTRRINHPDGSFKGVVVVSMDPKYFTSLYNDVDVGRHGVISLTGTDGVVRVRKAGTNEEIGQDISAGPLFHAMQANQHGTILANSQVDGRQRIYAYAKLNRYPLYAAVGIDLEDRLQTYYIARSQALLVAGSTTAIILLFATGIILLVGRLIVSRERAVAAHRSKARFLANMSHELRTPLNGILGYSELLAEELSDSTQEGFARTIHSCGSRLLALIDSILELSGLEAGKVSLSARQEHLRQMLDRIIASHAATAEAKQLELTLQVSPDAPAHLLCDRDKLMRVLDDLIGNAVQFTDAGAIWLTVSQQGDYLLFQVVDTGRGIPPALQRLIFERFSQVDDSPARIKRGAGLGLAISQRMIELMGGQLTLVSEVGKGSTFSFTLPILAPTADGSQARLPD